MIKFQRNYKLTIQEDGQEVIIIKYPITLEFVISRKSLSSAGNASFRLLNLSQENRGKIYKNQIEIDKMISIKLEAGYGESLSTIFNGNIQTANSQRPEGAVDFITEIKAYDYAFVMVNNESSFTVEGKEASKDSVIRRLCADLKYPVDGVMSPMPIGAIGEFDKTERRTYSVCGNTWEAIKKETDGKCFIDNGKVFCMADNEAIEGDITVIRSASGLLGTPRVDGIQLIFETIFEPALKIGQTIRLDSDSMKEFNGTYKIIGLDHAGVISGAQAGKCKTRITIMIGSEGQDNPFSIIQEGK